jgi:hypothetical protein
MELGRRHTRPPALLGLALLALALLASAFLSTAVTRAAEPGVVSDLSWGIPQADKDREVPIMQDAGVRWARLGLGWRNLEPSKGQYSSYWLADEDAAVAAARAAGTKVILDIVESPQWASGSTDKYAPPQNPQDMADFLRFIANRYRGQVAAYEIWNEENYDKNWPSGVSGPSTVSAPAYTQLLKAVYPAIKSVDPSALVVFGGLGEADYHYVEAAYAAGAKGYFDVMAIHPYTCWSPSYYYWADSQENWVAPSGSPQPPGSRITMWSFLAYREVHNSMVANGDGSKPIWLTEFGWSSATNSQCTVDQQTQASYLTQAYKTLEQDPYVQVALWYNLRQDYWATDSSYRDGGFGLINKDFTPRPAYNAFRDYATGSGSTGGTTTTSGGTGTTGSTTTTGASSGETTTTTTTSGKRKKKKRARAARARRLSARRG